MHEVPTRLASAVTLAVRFRGSAPTRARADVLNFTRSPRTSSMMAAERNCSRSRTPAAAALRCGARGWDPGPGRGRARVVGGARLGRHPRPLHELTRSCADDRAVAFEGCSSRRSRLPRCRRDAVGKDPRSRRCSSSSSRRRPASSLDEDRRDPPDLGRATRGSRGPTRTDRARRVEDRGAETSSAWVRRQGRRDAGSRRRRGSRRARGTDRGAGVVDERRRTGRAARAERARRRSLDRPRGVGSRSSSRAAVSGRAYCEHLAAVRTEQEEVLGADRLADLDVAPRGADRERPLSVNFMFPVPRLPMPAVEICSEGRGRVDRGAGLTAKSGRTERSGRAPDRRRRSPRRPRARAGDQLRRAVRGAALPAITTSWGGPHVLPSRIRSTARSLVTFR